MSVTHEATNYRSGYSIGVGGVVLCGDKCLLVRSAYDKREWAIPGGFVEHGETIDRAVQREILEEAGVQAEVKGMIAARNRITDKENNAYFVFLLHASTEEAQADGYEVTQAQYFTLEEIKALPDLNPLTQLIALRTLEGKIQLLPFQAHPTLPASEYVLYI